MIVNIFLLENNKYFVSRCKFEDLTGNTVNKWLVKNKPISLVETVIVSDTIDEDFVTIRHMKLHGIDNVRGGSFSECVLDDKQYTVLFQMIMFSNFGDFIKGMDFVFTCVNDIYCLKQSKNDSDKQNIIVQFDSKNKYKIHSIVTDHIIDFDQWLKENGYPEFQVTNSANNLSIDINTYTNAVKYRIVTDLFKILKNS